MQPSSPSAIPLPSKDALVLFYHPRSRARVARWMLEEVGVPYELRMVDFSKPDAELDQLNPMGKIPTLLHRGVVVTETAAICAYLADAFPEAGLAPSLNAPERGSYLRWLFFSASCLEPAMLDRSHPRANSPSASQLGHGSYDAVVRTLELAVQGGYLVGSRFSAADLYLAACIEWFLFVKALEPKPVFERYLSLCRDRPAYRRVT